MQAAEVPVGGRAIYRTNFVAEVFPDLPGGGVEWLDAAIEGQVNHPPVALLVHQHVDIGQVGPPVPRWHDRDADDSIACRLALRATASKRFCVCGVKSGPPGRPMNSFVAAWSVACHFGGEQFPGQTRIADEHGLVAHGGHEHAGMVVRRLVEQYDAAFECSRQDAEELLPAA